MQKKAVANARAICDAYDNNKTDELSDEVKGILEELKVPEVILCWNIWDL